MKHKQTIIFIAGGLNLPDIIKRIKTFYNSDYEIEVYGFDRENYMNINSLPDGIKPINLGRIEDGKNYIRSFFFHRKKLLPIFANNKKKDVVYFCFGFFPAFWAALYCKKKFIYQVPDLNYLNLSNSLLVNLFRRIDKYIIRKSALTIFSSYGFKNYLFGIGLLSNILVQPNKMNVFFKDVQRDLESLPQNKGISFGFIGGLRYPNTVFRFAKVVGTYFPMHRFLFYGDGHFRDEVADIATTYENVHFYGKFKNPEDLMDIYTKIDVVVACYDTSTMNERIAEPNKLYESLFFTKPIIVSENTFLSERVRDLQCGFAIDATVDQNIIHFIKSLTILQINEIKEKIFSINKSEIIDDPQAVFNCIDKLI